MQKLNENPTHKTATQPTHNCQIYDITRIHDRHNITQQKQRTQKPSRYIPSNIYVVYLVYFSLPFFVMRFIPAKHIEEPCECMDLVREYKRTALTNQINRARRSRALPSRSCYY